MSHAGHAEGLGKPRVPGGPIPDIPGQLQASIVGGLLLLAAFVLNRTGQVEPAEALAWISLVIGMVYGGRAALDSLLRFRFDIDALMVVAAALAAWIGQAAEGALLLFLFTLSGALEDRAMQRTMRAVEALHKLMPTQAMVRRGDQWIEVNPEELRPGDRVRVRTGELVPADARVEAGASSIDQATLTGESLPRAVGPGDDVYAGTINLDNPIEAEVVRPAAESSLQRVLNLVIEAQQQREPVQRVIDRLSQPYATGVIVLSLGVMMFWWQVLGEPLVTDGGHRGALYTAITLLIVASPCALVIATPTATLAAISRAARAGVLFKGGQAIERLARIGAVALDKTGTLTFGRPRLEQVHAVAWSEGRELLAVAAGLETGSTHPIASAVHEAAHARGVEALEPLGLENVPGHGLRAVIRGREARLGGFAHTEPLIPVCLRARVRDVLEKVRARGQIGVVAAWAGAPPGSADAAADQVAVLVLSDTLRPGAAGMLAQLHDLGVRPVRMLTGDNRLTAAHVAERVGIDQWEAELLPQDKVRILEEMKRAMPLRRRWLVRSRAGVAVVGDGVNDAPALAAADVSIAIGSIGSDAALESADIVLLSDDLMAVPWALRLARRTRSIVAGNLLVALGVIVGMGLATLVGSRIGHPVPLSAGVIAHEGGTLLVVLNSLRLLLAPGIVGPAVGAVRARAADRAASPAAAVPA